MSHDHETIDNGLRKRLCDGRVLCIALDRPEDRNCIIPGMLDRLLSWLEDAQHDPSVGTILLTGSGEHFCAGGSMQSLSASADFPRTLEERCDRARSVSRIATLLSEGAKPSVAMLRGAVAGGGLAIAAACDMRIASPTLRLSFAYSRIGLSGDVGAILALTRLLGPGRIRQFALLSPVLDAEAASAAGLVDRLVGDADLEGEAFILARRLGEIAPQAVAAIKQNIAAALALSPEDALAVEAENFARCQMHRDHAEAIRAFVEKRTPRFDGSEAVATAKWPQA
ncbi:2-(1,2-epoxy-1,2-dihydrophenyl)acetyl-CoA isomerase [Sphingobium faniae]|nr:2-(1,2-epoxy-1,2-dihydrophenyl)acetyl-CoA isomerase [Sphingobium faniae]